MLEVIYGQTELPRHLLADVRAQLEAANVTGTLYFGYPVLTSPEARQRVDALVVSKDCGVVGLLLASPPAPSADDDNAWLMLVAEQDGLFAALQTHIGRHQSLRRRRVIAVPIAAATIVPGGHTVPSGVEGEFVAIDALGDFLGGLDGISDPALFRRLCSALEHVVTLRPAKRRDAVTRPDSLGAKLKRIEQHIANLDMWQKRAAIETPDGPQRIRGLAGSGKTIVLALKAAYLHAQHPDWTIGVVFYTQSLYQQFESLIRRFSFEHTLDEPDWSRICLLHAWGSAEP